MKVFITGCSGKIGKEIINYLTKNKIYCYANYNKNPLKKKINKRFLKLFRSNILSKSFHIPQDVDVFCHIAYLTPGKNKKSNLKSNLKMSKNIFRLLKSHKNLKKFIFFSSAAIYDEKNRKKVDEKVKYLNKTLYAKSKFQSEKIFEKIKKIKVYNLRIPGVLGTGGEVNFISGVIDRIKKNLSLSIYNPNNLFNNLILASDLSRFILKLIKGNFKSGTILLGSSKPLKNKIIVKKLIDYFNSKSIVFWHYKKKGFYLNISKAQKFYKFKPQKTMNAINAYLKFKY